MKNVKQIWQETTEQLEKVYDQREAVNIAYLLLEDVFDINRTKILAEDCREFDEDKLDQLMNRLMHHEPIQYVTGAADFYGRKFQLMQGVLIPRPETEELCELIIKENTVRQPRILDVGVGCGCIAITLALELKVEVSGTDVSGIAIEIAKRNADGLGAKVRFFNNDILIEDLPENDLDILVSNPPYIPLKEQEKMRENVTRYEPELALFVPNEDPVFFYKRIAGAGMRALKFGGKLYLEIHENFEKQVKAYLEESGFTQMKVYQDMQGKERMMSATKV